ncbi:S66 peptidase family protein [Priestia flexa]|uniref:S66 peptidase family protein n=1 Tax=Priestia flexa TaxID=86664 RepID=UPI00077CB895|nr:LD-carboxypeptidase [Priestia flexa]MED4587536.1 LD-carboxypeptidase [Priestia flexa]
MMKPSALKKGDIVGVVSPASPPKEQRLKKGIAYLESLGLQVQVGKSVYEKNGYLAGTDEQRAGDINAFFANPNVKGIICACGGYGTARMADLLDYELIKDNPKIFWGYSDITFLHTAISQKTGLITFHGPMLSSDIGKDDVKEQTKQSFQQLFTPQPTYYTDQITPLQIIEQGEVSGQLIGGNLTLLASSLGTEFEVDTKGKILFIEDIEEEPYSIDRMMTQLKLAGKFEDAAGIMLCDFHKCEPLKKENSLSLEEALLQPLKGLKKPIMKGFLIGHCSPQIAVPVGAYATMSTYERMVELEAGVKVD